MNKKPALIISKYSSLARPLLFVLVLGLHAAALYFFNFRPETGEEKLEFCDSFVFKLVDVEEYVKPPVQEKIQALNQEKLSENVEETDSTVIRKEEDDFLPQHKISTVPVVPAGEVLSRIVYPPLALKQGIEAVVYLELYIDKTGLVKKVKVLKDPGHGFAEAAVRAVQGIKCIPACTNGKNAAVRYRYPVRFTIS